MLHPFVQIWSTLAQKPRWQWVKCQTRGLNSVLHAATLYKKTSCSVLLFYLASCIFTYAWIKIPKMKEITPGVTVLLYFQFTTHFPSVGYDDLCLALCSVQSAAPRLLVFLKDWQTDRGNGEETEERGTLVQISDFLQKKKKSPVSYWKFERKRRTWSVKSAQPFFWRSQEAHWLQSSNPGVVQWCARTVSGARKE